MSFDIVARNAVELVTEEEIKRKVGGRAYIGYEPAWPVHVGWLVWMYKARDLVEAGFEVILLEAIWHAWINDKGDMATLAEQAAKIRELAGRISSKFKFKDGRDLASDPHYWELVVRVSKAASLARIRRAIPIMGRRQEEVELDFSKLLYPAMQVADIFYLDVDVALGGLDQRRAHMLARDVAEKLGLKKPSSIHTPIITSLTGVGRMEGSSRELDEVLALYKMSKSRPGTAIYVTDTPEEISKKVWSAYCPPNETEFNPVYELAAYLLIPYHGPLEVGGRRYEDAKSLAADYRAGSVQPQTLKQAVVDGLVSALAKLR
ncbi:tyrosine--tRNA ligase [Thermoproteus tenax]|uniref:tyrosine--tRNA ligase n=1 Tax=Thermoproteus tenax (strain ATCC 35583 / DSM 2078 / JCM 9277 / NBRC 100435 / Kra 1) TaxID=768679 RepID=G4RLD1_THETK|nr:tyrosine--tRNA ligase [Thermoproteus tenax]CCC82376.1 Tyrosyl-tRNA synthetase [Thermoproteus tenax Kra 1]